MYIICSWEIITFSCFSFVKIVINWNVKHGLKQAKQTKDHIFWNIIFLWLFGLFPGRNDLLLGFWISSVSHGRFVNPMSNPQHGGLGLYIGVCFSGGIGPCLKSPPPPLFVVAHASSGSFAEACPALVTLLVVTLPCRKSPNLFELWNHPTTFLSPRLDFLKADSLGEIFLNCVFMFFDSFPPAGFVVFSKQVRIL